MKRIFIKAKGKIKDAKIVDNLISQGATLLEADEIEDTSIERNKNLPSNKNTKNIDLKKSFSMSNPWVWLIFTIIAAILIYFVFKLF